MRSIARGIILCLAIATAAVCQTSTGPGGASASPSGDAAVVYHWVRSNTQPGDCGCFDLNGGGISGSWNFGSHWAAVAEVSGEYAGNGPGTGNSLTLISYLAGARYYLPHMWPSSSHPLRPFTQVLLGASHAGGGIAGAGDGTTAFAARIGGGIDLPLGSTFALRILQADYDLTTFDNGVNSRQNNLLLGAGIVFRWSRGR